MNYSAGLHIVCEIRAKRNTINSNTGDWNNFMNQILTEHQLVEVGKVFHEFTGGGFTAVHCLTESHIAIHTWPEFQLVTFDVFLCNYERDNTELTEKIAAAIRTFFDGTIIQENKIRR